jgi:hypothetical protein
MAVVVTMREVEGSAGQKVLPSTVMVQWLRGEIGVCADDRWG